MRLFILCTLSVLFIGVSVPIQAEQLAKQSATISLKATGNGAVTVRDENGTVTEVIDQRQLRLNKPSPDTVERTRALRKERLERSKEVIERRKDERNERETADTDRIAQLEIETAAAAKAEQAETFKKYEEELALPLMDPWTGVYRAKPVVPDGYTPEWNRSDT